jgi:hypothetical protein
VRCEITAIVEIYVVTQIKVKRPEVIRPPPMCQRQFDVAAGKIYNIFYQSIKHQGVQPVCVHAIAFR